MNDNLKPGDKVKVPRTGGGYSDGEIMEIYLDRAHLKFPIGDTFRGGPVNPKDIGKMAYKHVALADLIPITED